MKPPNRGTTQNNSDSQSKYDIAPVLLHYGFDSVSERSGWYKLRCAFHGERIASATVNTEEGAFTCFSCGVKGDAVSLIRQQEDCSFQEALKIYAEITGQPVESLVRSRDGSTAQSATKKSYEGQGFLVSRLRKS